jgi:hypothetical protein
MRPQRRAQAWIAASLSLAAAFGMTSCSSGSPKVPSAGNAGSTTLQVPASTGGTPTTVPNVKAQLLSLSDLPSGWSVDNSPDTNSGATPDCFKKAKSTTNLTKAKAVAKFQNGSNGIPSLEEDIAYQPGHAQATMAQFAQVMAGCGQITFSAEGHTFKGTVGQMSFPTLGQQTEPYQVNLSTSANGLDVTIGLDLVAIRQGDEIAVLFYIDLGTPDINEVQQFAQKAASKLANA